MWDTRALTQWPGMHLRDELDARAAAGEFGPPVQQNLLEKAYWGLLDGTGKFTWHQLALFARVNGLRFTRETRDPSYPGLLFNGYGRPRLLNHVSAPDGSFDVGRYEGVDDQGQATLWTYAAFRLAHVMPQLVLDNRANDKRGGALTRRFAESQQFALGELFDAQWRLYAPGGYGIDVYQIIATDILETLALHEYSFDVEIVDDWLFLYSPHAYLFQPEFWDEVDEIRRTVVTRLAHRRYVDRHQPTPVAPLATAPLATAPLATAQPGGTKLERAKDSGGSWWFMVPVVIGVGILVFGALAWLRMMFG